MEDSKKPLLTVKATVHAPLNVVWDRWTTPQDVMLWNNASPDWHTPSAENDLRVGGNFVYRMEAKDGSFGFDFGGVYDKVSPQDAIEYTMGDGRRVTIQFVAQGSSTEVIENFEAEGMNSLEMQQAGWQAILNNFKAYVEGLE